MTVPQRQWPQAQRVRLDVQTGILVQLEEIGGHRPRGRLDGADRGGGSGLAEGTFRRVKCRARVRVAG